MLTTVGTEPVSLEDLEPFPGNARRGNVELILDSLRANGQYKPLTVRRHGETLTILAGNHSYLALLRHEEDDRAACVDWELANDRPCQLCIAVDRDDPTALAHLIECDDATATRINLVDNKAADEGGYDEEALAVLLAALNDDPAGTGYSENDLAQLLDTELPAGFPAYDESIALSAPASVPSAQQAPNGAQPAPDSPSMASSFTQTANAPEPRGHTCPECGHTFTDGQ